MISEFKLLSLKMCPWNLGVNGQNTHLCINVYWLVHVIKVWGTIHRDNFSNTIKIIP